MSNVVMSQNNIIFVDKMTKESKLWKWPMVWFSFLALVSFVSFLFVPSNNTFQKSELIPVTITLGVLTCYFLYMYLYTSRYIVVVSNESIIIKTLLSCREVLLSEIDSHSITRHKKTELYKVELIMQTTKVSFYTKQPELMRKIMPR